MSTIYTWYKTETENGSKVEVKTWITPGNAWSAGTRHTIFFVECNEIDLKIQKELDLPNWRWDYTGKGLVLEKGHQDWGVTQTHLDHLKIKGNWIKTHTT